MGLTLGVRLPAGPICKLDSTSHCMQLFSQLSCLCTDYTQDATAPHQEALLPPAPPLSSCLVPCPRSKGFLFLSSCLRMSALPVLSSFWSPFALLFHQLREAVPGHHRWPSLSPRCSQSELVPRVNLEAGGGSVPGGCKGALSHSGSFACAGVTLTVYSVTWHALLLSHVTVAT